MDGLPDEQERVLREALTAVKKHAYFMRKATVRGERGSAARHRRRSLACSRRRRAACRCSRRPRLSMQHT